MNYNVPALPPASLVETRDIYKKLVSAHRYLAELSGKFSCAFLSVFCT